MPDLLEWLRWRARLFADRTGKSHARPIQLALGDELQERSVQGHDVGLLHARTLDDIALQRVEHVLGGDMPQQHELAAIVSFLQAPHDATSLLDKGLDVKTPRKVA